MAEWKELGVYGEHDPVIFAGLNLWKHEWRRVCDEPVLLPHPHYCTELHEFSLYEVDHDGKVVRFAAGELSPGGFGFYVSS
jgi:hypothetical protein